MRKRCDRIRCVHGNDGRTKSWLLSLFALAFAIVLILALTACTVEAADVPATDPTSTTESTDTTTSNKAEKIFEEVKKTLKNIVVPDKIPHLIIATAIVLIVIGLAKKMLWLCVTAAILLVISFVAQSPIVDNVVTVIVEWVNNAIKPLSKGDYIGDMAKNVTTQCSLLVGRFVN